MKIKRQDTSIPVFSYVMDIFLFSHPLQLLITQHSLVQFFLHPVNEIGAAFVLPAFDISVEAVAVFRINPEYLIEKWGELFERHIAVVDAAHHVYAVDKFHEVDGIARPLKKAGGGFCLCCRSDGMLRRNLSAWMRIRHCSAIFATSFSSFDFGKKMAIDK